MRTPSPSLLRDTLATLERSATHVVWVDADDFAGLVQRLQGVNGLPFDWTKAVLAIGRLDLKGYGSICRYEPTKGASWARAVDDAPVDISRLALAEGSPG